METYSIDSITRCINVYEIIKRRTTKYPFAIFNTDKENEPGVFWIFNQKITYFYLTRLV